MSGDAILASSGIQFPGHSAFASQLSVVQRNKGRRWTLADSFTIAGRSMVTSGSKKGAALS
jgi:hypothetical protein